MIELMVFPSDADLRFKVSSLFLIPEWTAVTDEPVMGHPPIVCAGGRRFAQRIPGLTPMGGPIKPGASGALICHRSVSILKRAERQIGSCRSLRVAPTARPQTTERWLGCGQRRPLSVDREKNSN